MVFVHVHVKEDEAAQMRVVNRKLSREFDRLDHIWALELATELLTELPAPIAESFERLRSPDDPVVALLISGADLGSALSLPAPRSFGEYEWHPGIRFVNSALFLLGASIGIPYCFASQQRGRLVQDVVPLPDHESDQLGCNSTAALEWHNEDAFHPLRAGHTLLMCLRNDQHVATRFVVAGDLELDPEALRQLREPQFAIIPDVSHTHSYNVATTGVAPESNSAFARIAIMQDRVPRTAVLDNSQDDPHICVDFAYMPPEFHTGTANSALRSLRSAIERASRSIILVPGDVLVLDNRRCVHGRESFAARYDGTDRWLRRLNVYLDLAQVMAHQTAPGSLSIS